MSAPDSADVLVARAPDRLAVIVARGDKDAALALCTELHEHRADVRVALRCDGTSAAGVPARGRPMPAKFVGRCSACNGPINVGTLITYDSAAKKAFHARCS